MVDAGRLWDRPTAHRMGRVLERFNLVWLEEPLDARDTAGHAALAAALDTPVATGEMLTSAGEHAQLIEARAVRRRAAGRAADRWYHAVPADRGPG